MRPGIPTRPEGRPSVENRHLCARPAPKFGRAEYGGNGHGTVLGLNPSRFKAVSGHTFPVIEYCRGYRHPDVGVRSPERQIPRGEYIEKWNIRGCSPAAVGQGQPARKIRDNKHDRPSVVHCVICFLGGADPPLLPPRLQREVQRPGCTVSVPRAGGTCARVPPSSTKLADATSGKARPASSRTTPNKAGYSERDVTAFRLGSPGA